MTRSVRALVQGLSIILRAPLLVAGVLLITLAAAVPFGIVLGSRLHAALAGEPPISRIGGEINPEWWMEYRAHATGLEATFTPAVIGFAAPLDNLSALADGTRRPAALIVPIAVSGVVWAVLWGALLERFNRRRALGIGELLDAGRRYAVRFAAIGLMATLANLVLYLTVHAWLFGPVFEAIAQRTGDEREAFAWRIGLYAVFGVFIMAVGLVADYARVGAVVAAESGIGGALRAGLTFVKANLTSVVVLQLLAALLFAGLLVAYGTAETVAGSRLGGWRAIGVAQAYIVARLAIRLTLAASQVCLFAGLRQSQNR